MERELVGSAREHVHRDRCRDAVQAVGRESHHPSPGVQLTGGNRQIRTTVPPLARGVTSVIAWAGGGALGAQPLGVAQGGGVSQPVARTLRGSSRSGTNRPSPLLGWSP